VAATLAVAFLPFGGGRDARAVAVLEGGDGQVVALVEDFGRGRVEVTPLAEVAVARTESLQVWTKWSEEVGPVSVGLLDGFARAAFDGDLPAPVAGQLYEITREPRGGSPTGRPTGPVLALGLAAAP
jgi:anti-sigma-K factor RskA